MRLTRPIGQYKVIYFPLGRHTVKEMNPPGYLVYISSIIIGITFTPEETDGDSNKWNPMVPTGLRSTCNALKRQFSNKWDPIVPTDMGSQCNELERQLSNKWDLMVLTGVGTPCSGDLMVPPTLDPRVPNTDQARRLQLSTCKKTKQ